MKQAIIDNPSTELYSNKNLTRCFKWLRVIIFQSVATALLVYGILCSQYQSPRYPIAQTYKPVANDAHSAFVSCALFLCLCFTGQLTGAHCNPAVTIAMLISPGNKITSIVSIVYIFAQFSGALIGSCVAWALIQTFDAPFSIGSIEEQIRTLVAQAIGTFLFVLFILIIINDITSFIRSNFWNYILVPIAFLLARATQQIDSLNPATVLGMQVFYSIRQGDLVYLRSYWIYIIGPIIGAIASSVFFRWFYIPLFMRWKAKK